MLRAAFLWLSEQPSIFRFVRRNGLAHKLASRFVAGETVDDAITTLRDVSSSHLSASLDFLDRIRAADANANVSVKLTQMGLDIDEQLCIGNMRGIIGKAKQYDSFVRIDMEQSTYTAKTIALFKDIDRKSTRL